MTTSPLKLADYSRPADAPAVTAKPSGGAKVAAPARRARLEDAVDWSLWIESSEAATVLGQSAGNLRRDCQRLASRGMAMRAKGPGGAGQLRWWIKRDYNLKLHASVVGTAQRIPDDFYALSEAQRNQAMARAACVKRYRAMLTDTRSGPRSRWIDGLIAALRADHPRLKISERSLFRWHGLYNNDADLIKLADRRGGNRKGPIDPAAWQWLRDLYLHPNQLSLRYCHELTCDKAQAEGWSWHARSSAGYKQTLRRVRAEIPHVTRVQARDPERYRNTMSPHMVMDPDAFAPGERWQGDHCVLDLFCLFPGSGGGRVGRPWLTAWLDTKSRKCVGWVLCESPSSETIRAALALGLQDPSNRGGPDICHIDNGKDYKCEAFHGGRFTKASVKLKKGYADAPEFHGLFGLLDIKTIFAIPKNSRGKGAIEKWFDYCIHQRFDKLWDTYAGKDPDSRPPGLQAKLKDKAALPTFEDIRAAIALHIDQYNDSVDHGKQDIMGRSPNAVMLSARERVLADPGVLDFLSLTFTSPRRVSRHAVTIHHQGKALRYTSATSAFMALSNTDTMVRVGYRQADLLGQVYLFDAETMKMICSAEHERAGTSTFTQAGRANIKSATAIQRQVQKASQVIAKHGKDAMLPTEILALKEAQRQKMAVEEMSQEEASRGGKRLVQTPLDGQSSRLRALQNRQAAGAEVNDSSDDFLVERERLNARVLAASKARDTAVTVEADGGEEEVLINMAAAAARAVAKANGGKHEPRNPQHHRTRTARSGDPATTQPRPNQGGKDAARRKTNGGPPRAGPHGPGQTHTA